jgi:hypothetical protein
VTRRRAIFLVIFTLVALLPGVLYLLAGSPFVLDRALEAARSAGVKLDLAQVRGNLLDGRLEAEDLKLALPGVSGSAGKVKVSYSPWALLQRQVRLRVSLEDANVTIDPSKLGGGSGGEAPPVSVILEAVDLKNSRVSLDGRAWFIPNVSAVILEQTPDGESGQDGKGLLGSLKAKLSTPDGAGVVDAKYKVAEDGKFKVDLEGDLDARIARYWFDGIQAGRLAARYTVSSESFSGEGVVSGGVVEPLPGLLATQISGTVKHTSNGHVIGKLTGVGLEGPVTANVDVNIPKERWDVTGQLEPKLGLALKYFFPGVTGSGRSTVTVRGGGWSSVNLEGELVADGEVVGLPLRGTRGTWTARIPSKQGEPVFVLDVNANAATELFGGRVNLAAKVNYADGKASVDATARGKVLARDLALTSKITTGTTGVKIAANGTAFGGTVNARATILDSKMTGAGTFDNLNFDLPLEHSLSGRFDLGGKIGALEARGDFSRAKLIVPGVVAKDWPGAFVFRQVGSGIAGDLNLRNKASGLVLKGDLARGKIVASGVKLEPGGLANVTANYDLTGKPKLEGQARLREITVGGFSLQNIAGPWQLDFKDGVRGGWSTPQLSLEYTGDQLKAQTKNWPGQFFNESIKLSGGLEYGLQSGLVSGVQRGDGRLGQVTITGRGRTLELGGNLRYQALRAKLAGSVNLQPFSLEASSEVSSDLDPNLRGIVRADLSKGIRVTGQVRSAASKPLNLIYQAGQFMARGGLDLRTLEVALPPELRGQFAGVADLDVRGSSIENAGGTAQISGRYGNFPIVARVGLNAGQVTTDATLTGGDWRGARVVGAVYPSLNARVSYQDLAARVTGLANAFDFSLRGILPELPVWQSQNLELLRPDIALDGRFENAVVTASGRLGNLDVSKFEFAQNRLKANYSGDLNVRYAKEPIQAQGLEGDVRVDLGVDQRVNVNALVSQLEGSLAGQKFNASGLDVRLNQKDGLSIAGNVDRLTARVSGQNIRANGLELKALRNNGWQGSGNFARLETKIPGQASGQSTRLVDVDFTAASSMDGQLKATAHAARGVTSYGALKAWLDPVTVSIAGKDKFEITANSNLEGQALTESFGGSVSGRASLPFEASKWDADLRLNLQGNNWNLNANGPLEDARVFGRMPSRFLALAGVSVPREFLASVAFDAKVNARELSYRGSLNSTLESGYRLNATVNGKRERLNATLEALDRANGWARVNYSGGTTLGLKTGSGKLEAEGFNLEPYVGSYVGSAVRLDANLGLNRDRLEGRLSSELAGIPLRGTWRNGGFTGVIGGSVPLSLRSPSYRFPLEFAPLEWKTTSNDLPFAANGVLKLLTTKQGLLPRAEGELRLQQFGIDLPGGRAQLEPQPIKLAAQFRTAPSNTGLELTLISPGSTQPVRLTKNRWQGNLAMPYTLWDETGTARVTLEGPFEDRAWTDPNFKLETGGPLQALASGTLEDWKASAKLDLNGIQGDLGEEWRDKIKPGSLEVSATGSILPSLAVEANLSNLETSVDGQGVSLEASASYESNEWTNEWTNEWRADGALQAMDSSGILTSGKDSSANFRAGNDGGWLELNRLDLGLLRAFGLEASGTATGRVSLPEWSSERVFGSVQLDQASIAGVRSTGQLEVNAGQYQASLSGILPGDFAYRIDGSIAPRLEVGFALDGLHGTATGEIELRQLRNSKVMLEAFGTFLKRQASLNANLNATRVQASAVWDAARLTANARWLDGSQNPSSNVNTLVGTGRLEVSDLKNLTGSEGKLSSDLSFENLDVLAKDLRATIAGFDLAAAARFDGAQITATEFRASGQGLKATGSGLVWPKLDLGFNGSSTLEYAPGTFTGKASGKPEKPMVDLTGALSAAKFGLNADGTALTARFENNLVSLDLKGPRINGTARANLNALGGEEPLRALEAFDLQLDTELLSPSELPIAGKMRWDAKSGFMGKLKADGELLDSPALASLEGQVGRLEAVLNWRDGILRADVPGRLEQKLDGNVRLERFDLGALWGRPERLRIQADGQMTGSWLQPKATMRGKLEDASDELTAALELGYNDGLGSLKLTGPHLKLHGELDAKGWKASGQTTLLRLDSGLLPASLNLPEAQLGVTTLLEAEQTWAAGANGLKVRADNLRAVGAFEPIGDFELAGTANLNGNRLSSKTSLRALEGEVLLDGTLGLDGTSRPNERINVTVRGVTLERFGLGGLVAGTANLTGILSDPSIRGDLQLERFGPRDQDWWANGNAKLEGRLFDPSLRADVQLAGTGTGRSSVRLLDLLKPAPVVSWQGVASIPGLKLEGAVDGPWPLLNGNAKVSLDGVPEAISSLTLNARSGVLALSSLAVKSTPLLLGEVKLVPGQSLGDVGLDGKLRLNAKLEQFMSGANGSLSGDVLVSGRAFEPQLKLQALASKLEVSGFSAPDVKFNADFKVGSPLTATATYEGGEAKLEAGILNLRGLKLSGSGIDATVQVRGQVLNALAFDPDLRIDANLNGSVNGRLRATYLRDIRAVDLIGLQLEGTTYGATLVLDANASSLDGWSGDLNVTGLPALAPKIPGVAPETTGSSPASTPASTPVSESPTPGSITAKLDGQFAAPTLSGTGLIAGSGVRVQAQLNPLAATLGLEKLPGQTASASGAISLKDGSLSGKLEYALENLKLGLTASGSLERPEANLSLSRNQLSANAKLHLDAGKLRGEVRLSDSEHSGNLTLENDRLTGKVPTLNLQAFGLEGFSGQVGLETDLALVPNLTGRANLVWKNLRTPFEVPAFGFRIDGNGNAEIDPETSSLTFNSEGTPGTIAGAFSWRETQPSGSARLSLRGPGGRGAIVGEVALARGNLSGRAQAANLDLNLMGVKVAASGNISLDGLEFNASGQAQSLGGRITLSSLGGNLEEFVPGLSALLGREASGDSGAGLQVQARLDGVKLEEVPQLKAILPNASGRVSGVVGLSGSIATFGLTVPQLHLPTQKTTLNPDGETDLRLRVSGTIADGNVRYKGEFDGAQGFETGTSGASTFNGNLTSGVLTGNLELRHAPIHALLGSVFGPLPGVAFITGAAKYAVPLEKLTQGRVELIAENLELSGGGEALKGTLAAVYDKGGLILNKLALDGAGSWRGSGRYTPTGVDLKLSFQDTTFNPVLGLIPNLRDLNPSAKGTVQLEFSGAYDKPNASLQASNFEASIAGIDVASKTISGTLKDGALELAGIITSGGTVGGSLDTTANATVTSFSPIKIENLRAKANGSLTVAPIGKLENVIAEISGESGGFQLKAKGSKGGGPFTVEGPLSDRLDLKLKGQSLEISLPEFYIKDGLVDADLRMVQDGPKYRVTGDIAASRITSSTSIPRTDKPESTATSKTDPADKNPADKNPADKNPADKNDKPREPIPLLKRIELDRVRLTAPKGVRFSEPNLNLSLEAGGILTMTGTLGEPKIAGTLEALERNDNSNDPLNRNQRPRGSFNLAGFTYTLYEGQAAFNPLNGVYPVVTARGLTKIQYLNPRTGRAGQAFFELRAILRFRAQPSGVRIDSQTELTQYRANNTPCPTEPNAQLDTDCLSQAEALGLIALGNGNDFNDPSKLASGISTGALNQLLNAFVLREFSNAFTQATGVSFNVSTNVAETIVELFSTPEEKRKKLTLDFSVGGYITRDFYLEAFLGTTGSAFALTWTSEDGLFGVRYYQPIRFSATSNPDANLFAGSEVRLEYNFSRSAAINLGIQLSDKDSSTKFTIGGAWRF